MSVRVFAEVETVPGAPELPDGWRGLIDFGELWTEDDAHLRPRVSGCTPVGKPLMYGCVLTHERAGEQRVKIEIWSLGEPRRIMAPGAQFTLRDGLQARAVGHVL